MNSFAGSHLCLQLCDIILSLCQSSLSLLISPFIYEKMLMRFGSKEMVWITSLDVQEHCVPSAKGIEYLNWILVQKEERGCPLLLDIPVGSRRLAL